MEYGPFKIFKNCCMFWGKVRILKFPTIDIKTQICIEIFRQITSSWALFWAKLQIQIKPQISENQSLYLLCINSCWMENLEIQNSISKNWRNTEAKNDAIIFLPVQHKRDLFDWLMDLGFLNRFDCLSHCRNWELDYNFKRMDLACIHYGQCCLLCWWWFG